MPTTALEILSLEQAKQQLRLPSNAEIDKIVTKNIESAVEFIDNRLLAPLIERDYDINVAWPAEKTEPLWFPNDYFIKSIRDVSYWSPTADRSGDPDIVLTPSKLGRRLRRYDKKFKETYVCGVHPLGGRWADWKVDQTTPIEVGVTAGVKKVPEAVVHAITVVAYRMFDGSWDPKNFTEIQRLISGYETWLT